MVKNIELTVSQCWEILGKDPIGVINAIKNYGETDEDMIEAVENAFNNAKKIAKKLQAKLHPDRNPNDQNSVGKFNKVSLAIKCLGEHTENLRNEHEILKQRLCSSSKVIHFKEY